METNPASALSNIKTIRIIRDVAATAEKEMIKDFFRMVGCLFYDQPVFGDEQIDSVNLQKASPDVDIILNYKGSTEKIHYAKKTINLIFQLDDRTWGEDREQLHQESSRKELNKKVINYLIDRIWDDSINADSLKRINELYSTSNLNHILQMKRAFRVARMPEILGYDAKPYQIPLSDEIVSDYIKHMLESLYAIYTGIDDNDSVYSIYTRVNAARKIREIFNSLEEIPDSLIEQIVPCNSKFLLDELDKLKNLDDGFLGVFFLSAYVCQSDSSIILNAHYHYEDMVNAIAKETQVEDIFYAFMIHQMGIYNEKIWRNEENAFYYFQQAAQLDRNCYQARFKVASYLARQGQYTKAVQEFQEVINIILMGHDPENLKWANIPLKGIQYIYKAYIWMANIAEHYYGSSGTAVIYLSMAVEAAEAYTKNECLSKILDENERNTVMKYHKRSAPVFLLWELLENRAFVRAYTELQKEIEEKKEKLKEEQYL